MKLKQKFSEQAKNLSFRRSLHGFSNFNSLVK